MFTQLQPWILASASPRRAEILNACGFDFSVLRPETTETVLKNERPENYVARTAREKATWAMGKIIEPAKDLIVIASDTEVVLDGDILGKPATKKDNRGFLSALSGRSHIVLSAFYVEALNTGRRICKTVETEVRFKKIPDAIIERYVLSAEGADKAGGYSIQGMGRCFADSINGSFYAVMGFPIESFTEEMFKEGWLA